MIVESLYVHFPFCRHLCNYCDFHKSVVESDKVIEFQERLITQIEKNNDLIKQNKGRNWRVKNVVYRRRDPFSLG